MFYIDTDPSCLDRWLPPLGPKVDLAALGYSSEGGDLPKDIRRLFASYDVVFASVRTSPPYLNGFPVFDLQWVCRNSTLVIVRVIKGPALTHGSVMPAILRHWKPGGRISVASVDTIDERNQWVSFAKRWCRKGTELFRTRVEGDDSGCPVCSADFCACRVEAEAWALNEFEQELARARKIYPNKGGPDPPVK